MLLKKTPQAFADPNESACVNMLHSFAVTETESADSPQGLSVLPLGSLTFEIVWRRTRPRFELVLRLVSSGLFLVPYQLHLSHRFLDTFSYAIYVSRIDEPKRKLITMKSETKQSHSNKRRPYEFKFR
jgi:hypothetical protein